MIGRNQLALALVALSIALFTTPALAPVQPALYHDTGWGTTANGTQLQERGVPVVAYENLSDRGQELYVKSLKDGGEYRVPLGDGAPDFRYATPGELGNAPNHTARQALESIAIERPEDDSHLPPADEPRREIQEYEDPEAPSVEEQRQRQQAALRYDLMETRTKKPPLGELPQLLRLFAVLGAVLALGVGGYLFASK
jgi:hypothetical protein